MIDITPIEETQRHLIAENERLRAERDTLAEQYRKAQQMLRTCCVDTLEAAAKAAIDYGASQAALNVKHTEYAFHVVDDAEAIAEAIRALKESPQ